MKFTGREVHLSGSVVSSKCDFLAGGLALHQVFADERMNYGYVILEMSCFPQATNFNSSTTGSFRRYCEPFAALTMGKRDFTTKTALELREMSLAQNNQCLAVHDTLYNSTVIKPNRVITRDLTLAFYPDAEIRILNYFIALAEVELSDKEEITQLLKDNSQTVDLREESQGTYNPEPTSTGGV